MKYDRKKELTKIIKQMKQIVLLQDAFLAEIDLIKKGGE